MTVTRKGLAAAFLCTLIAILVSGQFYAAGNRTQNANTNAQRVYFIKSLGLLPDEENSKCKNIIVPETFSDVYKNYNDLQIEAGYDLSAYKGVEAKMFTYPVGKIKEDNSDDYYVNIIVYKGRIIGGDISSRNFYGEMLPLVRLKG